jgi:hypothetical protein
MGYLHIAYQRRDGWIVFIPVGPAFDPLRGFSPFARLTLRVRPALNPSS